MDLFKPVLKDTLSKDEIELLQEKKHEYRLLDSYSRTPGLKLYCFNPLDDSLHEVKIKYSDTLHCFLTNEGWKTVDFENQKSTIDSRFIYFEALNRRNALSKVLKFRNNLGQLCNLKPVKDGIITLW